MLLLTSKFHVIFSIVKISSSKEEKTKVWGRKDDIEFLSPTRRRLETSNKHVLFVNFIPFFFYFTTYKCFYGIKRYISSEARSTEGAKSRLKEKEKKTFQLFVGERNETKIPGFGRRVEFGVVRLKNSQKCSRLIS